MITCNSTMEIPIILQCGKIPENDKGSNNVEDVYM
jgi:hypothetical protein